MEIEMDIT